MAPCPFYFQRNTFQLVVATMESSSCAILLYPKDGLQFFSTSIGGETKTLETGFNEGLVQGWWWNTQQGAYFRVTTDEETSIRDLTEYESVSPFFKKNHRHVLNVRNVAFCLGLASNWSG